MVVLALRGILMVRMSFMLQQRPLEVLYKMDRRFASNSSPTMVVVSSEERQDDDV
jgi:hypothetical protein